MPHGTAKGREALDLTLALSDIHRLSLFFIGDGVWHSVKNQQPEKILARDYIATLGMLELYDINDVYISQEDLILRGLPITECAISSHIVKNKDIGHLLAQQDFIFRF